jgi:EAL domain-containing protein (putative c-di-GMP-specific phosphodiesterase class I)/GGDEF domain-containing protein
LPAGSSRLLGFAFSSADLFVEVDTKGLIAYAMGASETLWGASIERLVGRPWTDFIDPVDQPMVEALFEGLTLSLRSGPVTVRLAAHTGRSDTTMDLSAFRLPENDGATSVSLTRTPAISNVTPGALTERSRFEDLAAMLMESGRPGALELALLDLRGLSAARAASPPAERAKMEHRLAGVLRAQAQGGAVAAELGQDRFAIVRPRGEGSEPLAERIERLMSLYPAHPIRPGVQLVALDAQKGSDRTARALRYALDGFLRDGVKSASASLSDMLDQALETTLGDAGELGAAIRERRFRLVYQPVVTLKDGALHHYETLVRFGDGDSPYPLIRMAEEMELIEGLDLAIFEQALEQVAATPGLKLAVNVSGRTISSPAFIDQACRLLAAHARARGRLMVELTESAAIGDLLVADRHLQALRAQGCEICLDDFGAGAASLAYLQQLSIDVVKIDGRYIRDLQHGGREATFVKHLVSMCAELGVRTLAEMVETKEAEEAVRLAGVDMAQGWLYGAPLDTPQPPIPPGKTRSIAPKIRPGLTR